MISHHISRHDKSLSYTPKMQTMTRYGSDWSVNWKPAGNADRSQLGSTLQPKRLASFIYSACYVRVYSVHSVQTINLSKNIL